MEKYRTFADEQTGAQPFVPTYYSLQQLRAPPTNSRILSFLIWCCRLPLYPLLLVLALIRVLLLGLSLLAAGLLLLLLLPLRLLPYVHWRAKLALLELPLRLALFAFGYLWIAEESAGGLSLFTSLKLATGCLFVSLCPAISAFARLILTYLRPSVFLLAALRPFSFFSFCSLPSLPSSSVYACFFCLCLSLYFSVRGRLSRVYLVLLLSFCVWAPSHI